MRISDWSSDVCSSDLRMVDGRVGVQLAGVDRLLHGAQVHDREILSEDIVEAALRQAHVERHLATIEAVDADARTRLRALLAATGGLALAGPDHTTNEHPTLPGAGLENGRKQGRG